MAGAGRDGSRARAGGIETGWDQPENAAVSSSRRDWKRWLLVLGLGALSWVATFVGMLELIEANVGDLSLSHKMIIGFSVAMLMVMVVWLLDQIFSDIGWMTRLLFVGGYIFLTLISVGFGFGFYWKVLESRGESSRSAEAAVGQVQTALHAGVTRLEQLQGTLDTLTAVSAEKATLERDRGTSCPNSRPGDGPRRQLREDDASRFKFAADFVRGRVGGIKNELSGLNGDLARITANDRSMVDAASGTRNDFMRGLNRRLDMTVTGFNAFRSDPQLRQIRADLADRSDRVSFPDSRGGSFQCPDAQLSAALKGVVRAIDELPSLEKPKIAAVEGSEAVIEAFRRLSASLFGALSFKMPPSAEELRELQKRAVQSVEASPAAQARLNAMAAEAGLSKRDYIPLAIALFVDLCLLLVSIKRPTRGLDRLVPKMRAAEQGPVIQILSRFNEIHRDREIRENFEVFRHVVFDFHGDYYAAVPLNAPLRPNPHAAHQMHRYGVAEAESLVQEAHLLANLFTSFEKEKIFTRVMSPLLTTATIQKRLRRQGSKFANAEAFRVYRFRNGAWSEIILGAVMGAARRVEADKRRRRAEADVPHKDEPDRDGPQLSASALDRLSETVERLAKEGRGAGAASRRNGQGVHTAAGSGTGSARPRGGFSPRLVPTSGGDIASRSSETDEATSGPDVAQWEKGAGENVVLHPAVGRTPGNGGLPGWEYVPASGTPRETIDGRTVSDDDPASPSPVAGPVPVAPAEASLVRRHTIEPTVTVAATRESVTYTLPASEARLPESLLARAGPRDDVAGVVRQDAGVDGLTRASIRPLPVQVDRPAAEAAPPVSVDVERPPVVAPAPQPDAHQDALRAIALRFGPQPREE